MTKQILYVALLVIDILLLSLVVSGLLRIPGNKKIMNRYKQGKQERKSSSLIAKTILCVLYNIVILLILMKQ